MKRLRPLVLPILAVLAFAAGLAGCKSGGDEAANAVPQTFKASDIRERLAKFSPTEIAADEALLSPEDRPVLNAFIEAARLIDRIFWDQAYSRGWAMKEELERSTVPGDKDYLRFLEINFGPFDRQDENTPFIGTAVKPAGAGFYPSDLTKEEFETYAAAHPAEREALESPFTVIKRDNGKLIAVPYSEVYKDRLLPIAQRLRDAAALTLNPSLKKYLERRAADLLTNDYYESDCLWIDLKDNRPEIVIGPFEVYEDGLLGIKASFESFVYVNDFEAMKKLRGYLDRLDSMQRNLPVEPKYKTARVTGLDSPLNVVHEVFTAGDTKAGVQTSAFVLPNDEKVREKKGTKKVFLKNMMEAKFSKSLIPISQRVLVPADAARVTFDAYFTEVLLHEISHVLGVNYVVLPDGTKTTVGKALKDLNAAIGEGKADIVGMANVPLLIESGLIPKAEEESLYASYLAGMFRSMRFGATEAHGLGVLIQYNFMRENGAFVPDAGTGRLKVDFGKIRGAIRDLAAAFLVIEGDGDYAKAKAFVDKYRTMDDATKTMIETLKDIPVDIYPVFRMSY
jgi:hypothetical protein